MATPDLMQAPADLIAGTSLAVAYSGYRRGQHPDRGSGAVEPSEAEILEDLRLLTRHGTFGLIRLYGTGTHADRVLSLIRQHDLPLKVMQGAWLQAEVSNHEGCEWLTEPIPEAELAANRSANAQEVERVIALAKAYPKIIVAVNVGNEVLVSWTDHLITVEAMHGYLAQVKDAVTQPVTVAENYVAWADHGAALRDVIDFAAVHTYPVWEGKDIDEGMSFTLANLRRVRAALPGVPLAIGEAGWATVASEFGPRASQAKQTRYYTELTTWARQHHVTTFVFEAFDEDWKGNPADPMGAEKHWGLFSIDRRPKQVMQKQYPALPPATPAE